MGAAYNGDADEIVRLLAMPCDIDAQDKHGTTALMYAAMRGHRDAVRTLIEHKADLEIQSGQRWTALMYAVRDDYLEVVQELLSAGADPNVHGDYDTFDTPLTLAAWRGHFTIVRALVGADADVGLHGGVGQLTAECIARHQGYHEISELLLYHEKRPSV
jgi:ankyrin repeat protein